MIAFSLLSTSLPEVEEPLQRERDRSKWNCGQNDDTDYLTSPPPSARKNWWKTDKTIRGKWNFQGRLLAIPRFAQLFVNCHTYESDLWRFFHELANSLTRGKIFIGYSRVEKSFASLKNIQLNWHTNLMLNVYLTFEI